VQGLVSAASAGDKSNFALNGSIPPGDKQWVRVYFDEVGMGGAKSFDGFGHYGLWVVDEFLHGGALL